MTKPNHEIRIIDHTSISGGERDEATITIKPPIARLAEVAIAAIGQASTRVWLTSASEPAIDRNTDDSRIGFATFGGQHARAFALQLLADRVQLLADEGVPLKEMAGDAPFSKDGWTAIERHIGSAAFTGENPYYGDEILPGYSASRVL